MSDKQGIGPAGKAFMELLKRKLLEKTISTYAVNYSANWNFSRSTSEGALDANKHVQYVARVCPATKIVLGGMSQGSGVIDLITLGNRKIWVFTSAPLPDTMTNHVAAVAVFGNPIRDMLRLGPLTTISPRYGDRAIDLCAVGDP